jgi:hypothetical protein
MVRMIVAECKNLKIKVNKTGNLGGFKDSIKIITEERKKAENILLDEIEQDILQKEHFLSEQVDTVKEMNTNLNLLIEHKSVIQIASNIISET